MRMRSLHLAVVLAVAGCATSGANRAPAVAPAARTDDAAARVARLLDEGARATSAGDFARAEAAYGAAAALAPADPRPLVRLADVLVAQRRFEDALVPLGRAAAAGDGEEVRARRGRVLALARRFDEARDDLERAVALAPRSEEAWAALGAVEVSRGDDAAVRRALDALTRLAGPRRAAERLWVALLSIPPDPVQPQETLDRCTRGHVAMLQGQWAEAQREQLSGLRYSPAFAWCAAGFAESTWRLGEARTAEPLLRRAIAAFPAAQAGLQADAKARLGALLLADGGSRAAEAASLARDALAARGDRAAVLDLLARACEAQRDAPCAVDASRRLLALPRAPEALRADAERRLGAVATSAAP